MIAWRFFVQSMFSLPTALYPIPIMVAKIIMLVVASAGASVATNQDVDKNDIEFAEKRESPVIIYDLSGGYRGRAPTKNAKPRLQIWPSGKVVCGTSNPNAREIESEIDAKQLKELLQYIVKEQIFSS